MDDEYILYHDIQDIFPDFFEVHNNFPDLVAAVIDLQLGNHYSVVVIVHHNVDSKACFH